RPAALKLTTSPGLWAFEFTMGSADHPVETKVKYIDKYIFEIGKGGFREWEYAPVNSTVYVRGSAASLRFEPPEKGKTFTINALIATNRVPWSQRIEKSIQIPKPEPWSPGSPNLYELRVTLVDSNGRELDDTASTFGVVTLEDRDGELFVNGERYRIRGVLETHSFPPERDDDLRCIAPPDKWIVQDILDNKKANVNMMRFHPAEGLGTNYSRWLDFADQLGMFVIWSPRQWFHWGNRSEEEFSPLIESNLEPSMIRTRNYASVFAWEGGNETYYNDEIWDDRARKFADEFYNLAESLDPSRFILPISFWYAQFEGKADFYKIDPNRGNELTWPGSGRSPLSFWAPNVFWDVHPYPGWYGSWAEIWWGAGKGDSYKKDKIFFISEFGAEGMPNWDLYKNERYYHAWENSASSAAKHEKNRLGRNLGFDEWEISQAYQALVMHNAISVYRTEDADGLAICTGAEGRHNGRYFKGIRDMYRRPKLAYYATRTAYSPLFVEGLNGDIILSSSDSVEPVVVNDGPAADVNIEVVFKDMSGKVVDRQTIKNVVMLGAANVRPGVKIKPENLVSGNYYSVEYIVSDKK
ncbi:MAG TPA: glycoside hydrolase family 2 TIM barrel-domain containing protein, partial [bacterium]|nr:glycoside hydrolase family 2 TIM barrel-domain containing protein [bacterium]